ncbi:MAG TPA: glycoside hydrolase family 30 beta sandwich domain-containing protein [Terriglobia bacterium]|nr:glycoside hydrolase family 30 beta sandwich domain-containing protein [Terriglobia bacterium]
MTCSSIKLTGRSLLAALVFFVACGPASAQEVTVYVSSKAGDRLALKAPMRFEAQGAEKADFVIDDSATHEKIVGFGASFLEGGLICLNSLEPADQEAVLRALFDPEDGAGFTAMKTPIAATDFMSAGPWYTYDDTPGDVELKHFSIQRDLGPNGLITYIKRARKYGSFVLQAPVDYPPDWMLVDVNSNQDVDPKYYDALARYYLRYLQEYEKHGVFIDYLSLFNEPGIYTKISYSEIRDLLKNHVGPLFEKQGVKTRIQLSEAEDRERAYEGYPTVLDDPEARKYVANLPYHGYDWKNFDKIADLHRRYPDLPLWMTEICYAYEASTPPSMPLPRYDFEDGDFWGNQIVSDLEAGASAWIYWNMILDEQGGPWLISEVHGNPPDNIQHPVVIIDRQKKQVTYTGLYYYLAHFSKFVRPGSVRIETAGRREHVRCIAFLKPDGTIVAEVLNSQHHRATVSLGWRDRAVNVELPPLSITTYIWNVSDKECKKCGDRSPVAVAARRSERGAPR